MFVVYDRSVGRRVGIVGMAAVCGCNLVVDLDGFTTKVAGAPDSDAGPSGDAGLLLEAGGGEPDADADADLEAGTRFCSTVSPLPLFCEDFETTPFPGAFTGTLLINADASFNEKLKLGGARALRTKLLPYDKPDKESSGLLTRIFTAPYRAFRAELWVRVEQAPNDGTSDLFVLELYDGSTKIQLGTNVHATPTGTALRGYGARTGVSPPFLDIPDSFVYPKGTWIQVRIELFLGNQQLFEIRELQPTPRLIGSVPTTGSGLKETQGEVKIFAGAWTHGVHTGWDVHFDDIVFDAK